MSIVHGKPQENVIWHEVECGDYVADLAIWEELAGRAEGPILELGSGTGRVALHLARRGHEVVGLDIDPTLVAALQERAGIEALPLRTATGDAAAFALGQRFGLILAPMQLIQLLPGSGARGSCLAGIAGHLRPGGLAALSIVEGSATGFPPSPPVPDVRERDGWVYSSLPLGIAGDGDALLVERLRQTVSPAGELHDQLHPVRLQILSSPRLEAEAEAAGLRPAGRRRIAATESHVGSTVVLVEAV